MFIITAFSYKRWRIEKGNHTFFSGIGGLDAALRVASAHGIVISKIKSEQYLRAA